MLLPAALLLRSCSPTAADAPLLIRCFSNFFTAFPLLSRCYSATSLLLLSYSSVVPLLLDSTATDARERPTFRNQLVACAAARSTRAADVVRGATIGGDRNRCYSAAAPLLLRRNAICAIS
jgi:hypothetical protein